MAHQPSERDLNMATLHTLQGMFVTEDSDDKAVSALLKPSGSPAGSTSASPLSTSFERRTGRLEDLAAACKTILECLGEDVAREGLHKTPLRMAKALLACTSGYAEDAKSIIEGALFSCDSEEMVVVRDIDCYSMCEHHMLPFYGKVSIAYIPRGKVLGLSKFARITDMFSKRLQIQEQLTAQIANAIQEYVGAAGVAVMSDMTHMCMAMRGVEKTAASTVSVSFTGIFKTDAAKRSEFMELLRTAQASKR